MVGFGYPSRASRPMDLVTTAPAPASAMRRIDAPVSSIMPDASMVGLRRLSPANVTVREVIAWRLSNRMISVRGWSAGGRA